MNFAFVGLFSAISGLLIYGLFWTIQKKVMRLPQKVSAVTTDKSSLDFIIYLNRFFSGAYHATTKWDPYTLSQMVYEPSFKTEHLRLRLLI
jgi:hypothetical protein